VIFFSFHALITASKMFYICEKCSKTLARLRTGRAYDSNFCFDIWRVTNADYLLTYLQFESKK